MSITFSHAVRSQTLTFMDHLAPGDEWRAQRIFGLVRVAPENLLIMMLDICRQLAVSRGQTKWKPTESCATRIAVAAAYSANELCLLTARMKVAHNVEYLIKKKYGHQFKTQAWHNA